MTPDPVSSSNFRNGQVIRESGIYRVTHSQHRVPHEVTLIKGETFPRCEKCDGAVRFKLLRAAADLSSDADFSKFGFKLYCLPVMEEVSKEETAPPKKEGRAA